jgi:hypothetical protein
VFWSDGTDGSNDGRSEVKIFQCPPASTAVKSTWLVLTSSCCCHRYRKYVDAYMFSLKLKEG